MQLFSQRDSQWAIVQLGWGPPGATIGKYGCLLTCYAMVMNDAGLRFNQPPLSLDQLAISKQLFVKDPDGSGDFDLLPDNLLDLTFPGRFRTISYWGFPAATVAAAVRSQYSYAILWISTGTVPTHFVIAYTPDASQIADPWTGHVGALSGYGGQGAVHKVLVVTYIPPAVSAPVVAPVAPAPTSTNTTAPTVQHSVYRSVRVICDGVVDGHHQVDRRWWHFDAEGKKVHPYPNGYFVETTLAQASYFKKQMLRISPILYRNPAEDGKVQTAPIFLVSGFNVDKCTLSLTGSG